MTTLNYDCQHFPGDRPCHFHKENGVHCDDCTDYAPAKPPLLVVKLGSLGDVLRTTSILKPLAAKYPNHPLYWVSDPECHDLFKNNPYVARVLSSEDALSVSLLKTLRFQAVFVLEATVRAALIGQSANAAERFGFGLKEEGYLIPLTEAADDWLKMSAFDDVKRANQKTYQRIIADICGLKDIGSILVNLTAAELAVQKKYQSHPHPRIGINLGSGKRWPTKRWPISHFVALAERLYASQGAPIFLFGLEEDLIEKMTASLKGKAIYVNTKASVRDFFSHLNVLDVLVTGDTLALHAAVALGKRVVALFGPTSAAEIELYDKGLKLEPTEPCRCYYQDVCTSERFCMETISVDHVFGALEKVVSREKVTRPS